MRSLLHLLLLIVKQSAEQNLLFVPSQRALLLLPVGSFHVCLIIEMGLEQALELLAIPALLALSLMLSPVVLLDLSVAHQLLFLDQLLQALLLIFLFLLLLFLLRSDVLEVFKVVPLLVILGDLVLLHLFLEFKADAQLILANLHLDGILFLLELVNVMHDNLCPVVLVFGGRGHICVRTWAQNLVTDIFNGGRTRSLGSV